MRVRKNLQKATYVTGITLLILFFFQFSLISQPKPAKPAAKKADKKADKTAYEEINGWRITDFKPYISAIKDLEKLSERYAQNHLKLAIDEYNTGLDILEDMETIVKDMIESNMKRKNLNERFYWQEIDRKNQEMRRISRKKHVAKMKAITYFTRSIHYLDAIENEEIKTKDNYKLFQSKLFQVYVSTNYDLHNFKPCIPILERYITLRDENRKDVWAYKYLASAYGYMETVLTKYKHATEDEIMDYKTKKNRYLLQAVELKYGVKSPQFDSMYKKVQRDEKKSQKINDFK